MEQVNKLIYYMASNSVKNIWYYAFDMVLNVHLDTSHMTPIKTSIRASIFFLGSLPVDGCPSKLNGAILTLCTILMYVAVSAAKAELGALLLNAMEANILRLTFIKIGHPQPTTPIHADNTTAVGNVNNTIKRQ